MCFKIEAPTARLNLMEQLVKGYMKEKLSAARTKTVAEITKRASKGETALDEEEQFNYAVQELMKSVFPKKALMLQKFYMQYYMRKPVDTSVSEYRARVTRLNLLIESFPPFLKNQGFSDNELKAMVYFNCLLYTSPSPRDGATSRMPSSA